MIEVAKTLIIKKTLLNIFLAFALFIFGPSCGGKSTLSHALIEKLGPSWIYIDRDEMIENDLCSEEEADQALDKKIQELSHQNLLIDSQLPWRAPYSPQEKTFLVYAPLEILLKRDEKRCLKLNRSPKRAFFARQFVEKTFFEVFKIPENLGFSYDMVLDSSKMTLAEEINQILAFLLLDPPMLRLTPPLSL